MISWIARILDTPLSISPFQATVDLIPVSRLRKNFFDTFVGFSPLLNERNDFVSPNVNGSCPKRLRFELPDTELAMKLLLVALTLSLLTVVLAATERISSKAEAFDPSMPTQQSYELRCRGGGLKFSSTPGRTSSSGEQMINVTIDFAVGTQGAGTGKPNLNPGQCSWIDRGFRPGEPPQIRLEIVSFAQQQQALHGSPVDRTPTAAERFPDAQNVPQYLSSSDHYWTFWVYNTANGYLQSTNQRSFKLLKTVPGGGRFPLPSRPGNVNESF